MIIYLASPCNQLQAEMMSGCDVLESFALSATAGWARRYRPTWGRMMLDSGAFSEMTTGKPVDLGAYIAFACEHAPRYELVVNLDVISGNVSERVDASARNLETMRAAGLDPLPVFHQGEPWSVLESLASNGKVGLGFQRPIKDAERWLSDCFDRIPTGTYVHGFAMANQRTVRRFPFSSVDSATWFHELRALSAVTGQGSDVLNYLTQGELLRLVLLKYARLQKATAWSGAPQMSLFHDEQL